jgi:NAD+ diphosphatase
VGVAKVAVISDDPIGVAVLPLLARAGVDRAAHLRSDPEVLRRLWTDPRAQVLRVDASSTAVVGEPARLAWLSPQHLAGVAAGDPGARYFLGLDADGTPRFAIDGAFVPAAGESVIALRRVGPWLVAHECSLFVQAVALSAWHSRYRFCPGCGAPTEVAAAGHSRVCTGCGLAQFPRIEPAVIMLVSNDDDRVLLAHNPAWPPGRFSTLAGFVEAGESPEQAVAREVHEEVGLIVDHIRYEGSQPWPLPSSVMLAFSARAADSALVLDGVEITDARWFSRTELLDAMRRKEVLLPSSASIARWQVERWYGEPLPTEYDW